MTSTALAIPNLLSDLQQAGALTINSLVLTDPDISYERAESLCRYFGMVGDSSRWWQADLLLFLEKVKPEEFSQLSEAMNITPATRSRIMRVADRIPPSQRRVELSFSHHFVVCHLGRDERIELLDQAVREGWSKSQLDAEVKEPKARRDICQCPVCGKSHTSGLEAEVISSY